MMADILVIHASSSGNTEIMADVLSDYFQEQNHTVDDRAFDFDPVEVEELRDYDAVLIGTHTWDDGSLPYEVEDFDEELDETDITGPLYGLFGSADSFYEVYGGAVDIIYEHLEDLGASLVPDTLKVDLKPDDKDVERCRAFGAKVCQMLEK